MEALLMFFLGEFFHSALFFTALYIWLGSASATFPTITVLQRLNFLVETISKILKPRFKADIDKECVGLKMPNRHGSFEEAHCCAGLKMDDNIFGG